MKIKHPECKRTWTARRLKKESSMPELFQYQRKHSHKFLFVLICVLISLVSAIMIMNAAKLKNGIEHTTQLYMHDVSAQTAKNINLRLKSIHDELELIADSVSGFDGVEDQINFMQRKRNILQIKAMVLIDAEGEAHVLGDYIEPSCVDVLKQSKKGEKIAFLGDQDIAYLAPVLENGNPVGMVAGIYTKEDMQEMIQSDGFNRQGLSCITDKSGKVVISPTDLKLFLALDDIFSKEQSANIAGEITQMKKNMERQKNGMVSFTASDNTKVMMAYTALKNYDWVLLTLVQSDIISYKTDWYILMSLLTISATILIFIIVIAAMLYLHRGNQKHLEKIAFMDSVTGGMNNIKFQMMCLRAIQENPAFCYSIVALNMRKFKLINENFGSKDGDQTLRHILTVLEQNLLPGEFAARAEADLFYLCLREKEAGHIQMRMDDMICRINAFNGSRAIPYYLKFQMGVYIVDDPSLEITVMQDRANIARKSMRDERDNECVFYDSVVMEQLKQERELNDMMEASLKKGEFEIYLQPKIRLDDETVGGAEALVRWQHPDKGFIYPSVFIPSFEKSGKICRLDLYVFEEVCKWLRRRIKSREPVFPVSVNLSRKHFKDGGFLEVFHEISQRYEIPDGLIEMELTESIFFNDDEIEFVKYIIQQMHKKGFLCSLDDFGSGYSSLGLLKEFDVDTIKLDRRFFGDIASKKAQDVVEAMVGLSKKLRISTVAEGIETKEGVDFLKKIQCDMVQGYVYSKPLRVSEFEQWAVCR